MSLMNFAAVIPYFKHSVVLFVFFKQVLYSTDSSVSTVKFVSLLTGLLLSLSIDLRLRIFASEFVHCATLTNFSFSPKNTKWL